MIYCLKKCFGPKANGLLTVCETAERVGTTREVGAPDELGGHQVVQVVKLDNGTSLNPWTCPKCGGFLYRRDA